MGEQMPDPCIIAQHGIEETVCDFEALRIDYPCGVGFRTDRLPQLFLEIVG
jgi:hypothetical protein